MTAQYRGKVFKAGNSAAVRLPKDVAFALGTELTIVREGDTVTIRPAQDRESIRRGLQQMADEIQAIWADMPDRPREQRLPIDVPERGF